MERAWARVRANKGKPGIDGMSVKDFPAFSQVHIHRIIDQKYLRAGVRLKDGTTEKTLKGVPQGGPLSPLLANIMLDPLDKKIEAMGLPFARYADDFLVVTRSKTRALEVMEEVREYVEGKLKLLVNQDTCRIKKSGNGTDGYAGGYDYATRLRPLGYAVARLERLEGSAQAKTYVDQAGRLTGRSEDGFTFPQGLLEFRACDKTGREANRTMSQNSLVRLALNNTYLANQGVPSMRELWVRFKYGDQAKV